MDQYLVASLALVAFTAFLLGAYIVSEERKSRKVLRSGRTDIHSGPDDVEKRARRAF
jgi:hypothetical protein